MSSMKRRIYMFDPNEPRAMERLIAYKRGRRKKGFNSSMHFRGKGKMAIPKGKP